MVTRRQFLFAAALAAANRPMKDAFANPVDDALGAYLAGAYRVYTAPDNAAYWRLLDEQSHDLWFCQAWAFVFDSEPAASLAYAPLDQMFRKSMSEAGRLRNMEEFPGDDPELGAPWTSWVFRGEKTSGEVTFTGCLQWQYGNIIHAMKGKSFQDTVAAETAKLGQQANRMEFRNRPVAAPAYDGDISRGGAFDVLPGFRQLVQTELIMRPEMDAEFSAGYLREALRLNGVT